MPAAQAVRSKEIQWNGSIPTVLQSHNIDLATAVPERNAAFVDVGMTLKEAKARVRAAPDATAVLTLEGVVKGSAYATITIPATASAGDVIAATINDADVPANEVLFWKSDGGSTSAATADGRAVLVPKE